jgi:hypothetical protein
MRTARLLAALVLLAAFAQGCTQAPPPVVSNIPFADGETFTYDVLQGANPIGTVEFRNVKGKAKGADAWQLDTTYGSGLAPQERHVFIDASTLKPIMGDSILTSADSSTWYHTDYTENKVTLAVSDTKGAPTPPQAVPLPKGFTVDTGQLLQLVRALPLAVGYKTAFLAFDPVSGKTARVGLQVASEGVYTYNGQDIPSFTVNISFSGDKQTAVYEAAGPRRLFRYDAGGNTFVLK